MAFLGFLRYGGVDVVFLVAFRAAQIVKGHGLNLGPHKIEVILLRKCALFVEVRE